MNSYEVTVTVFVTSDKEEPTERDIEQEALHYIREMGDDGDSEYVNIVVKKIESA